MSSLANRLFSIRSLLLVSVLGLGSAATAAPAPFTCTYTVGMSRSDHGPGEYRTVKVQGRPGASFSFQGCSASGTHGAACVSTYGVSAGARLLVDQNGQTVAEGDCCNDVVNAVTSVSQVCTSRFPLGMPATR